MADLQPERDTIYRGSSEPHKPNPMNPPIQRSRMASFSGVPQQLPTGEDSPLYPTEEPKTETFSPVLSLGIIGAGRERHTNGGNDAITASTRYNGSLGGGSPRNALQINDRRRR